MENAALPIKLSDSDSSLFSKYMERYTAAFQREKLCNYGMRSVFNSIWSGTRSSNGLCGGNAKILMDSAIQANPGSVLVILAHVKPLEDVSVTEALTSKMPCRKNLVVGCCGFDDQENMNSLKVMFSGKLVPLLV